MNYQQDLDIDIDHQNQPEVLSVQQKRHLQAQVTNKKSTLSIRFSMIVKLFQKMSSLRGVKKSHYLREFLKIIFKSSREPPFIYSLLRILLPADDHDRGNYGLKEKGLAKVIADCLGLQKSDFDRLYHYKNPNFHQTGFAIGDFSLCVFQVAQKFCKQKSDLTVTQLNILLDQLALSNGNYSTVFRQLFQKCTPQQIKWIMRIVLKDLKLSIKLESVLNCFHKDAHDFFNLTNNLLQVCKKFQNPKVSLDDQIAIFSPIRPMLAGKKNITFFQTQTRPYFIETKYDGQRIQAHNDGKQIKLFSRNAINYSHVYKQIIDLLTANIQADACILDGEVIVLEKNSLQMVPFGMNKVVALSNSESDMQLCYMVFDILWIKLDNEDTNMMKFPLQQRKRILQNTLKTVPGKLQIVLHKVISQFDDILQEFGASISRNQEGIMLKDPESLYVPKERGINWLKLKGDYVDGLTDTLDLIIIGGYFGDKSYRQGESGHWIDKVTTFALGLIDKNQQDETYVVYPFAKVGTGYNAKDLALLRQKLKNNIHLADNKFYPPYLKSWKHSIQDKPDCWVKSVEHSIILEVKAAQIITSDSYPTGSTLRFPRVVKIRYDKDWHQAFTIQQLEEMRNNKKFTKNMKRINEGSGSDGERDKKSQEGQKNCKKVKTEKGIIDKKTMKHLLLDDFKSVELAQNDLKRSNLFYGLEFVVLPLIGLNMTRHQVQRQIILNGGNVSQNPLQKTNYLVADHIDFRLKIYQNQKSSSLQIIKPKYIMSCIRDNQLLPITPLYLTCLPPGKRQHFKQNFDRFCDSYTGYLNERELDQIMLEMDDTSGVLVNQNLVEAISVRQRRAGIKSLCVGLSRLEVVKLKSHGNLVVERLRLEEKIESIIIKGNLQEYETKVIDDYREVHPETVLQYAQDLKSISIL